MIATAQQINTLLYYLTSKQTPPFAVRFWSNLQKIDFDYSEHSIQRLGQFFTALSTRQFQLRDLLADKGGQALVIAVAAYIADYLAKTTGQSIVWYDYAAMSEELASQNRHQHTYLQIPANFYGSLTARIGQRVYCQPLQLLPRLLNGEAALPPFIAQMTQTICQQSQVNLLQAADKVCYDYLAKVKTGKLYDPLIGFFAYLADVHFDYSRASLVQIDHALSAIDQDFSFKQEDYLSFVQDPSRQAFCYLLGFYIGVTSSRLANIPVRWVSYEQMYESLGDEFSECLEHSFVLLLEDGYRTPLLVVTNRLFGLAEHFPTTAIAFADMLQTQHSGQIEVRPYLPKATLDTQVPPHWLTAMQAAGAVVAAMLSQVSQGQPIFPYIYQARIDDELSAINLSQRPSLQGAQMDALIDSLYQTLYHNPQAAAVIVGCFESYVNLPMGRTDGIVIEVRAYDHPTLQLQLILPYRTANDSHSLIIYPLVSYQNSAQEGTHITAQQTAALIQYFYQAVVNNQSTDVAVDIKAVWEDAYVNQLDIWAISPKDERIQQQKFQRVDSFDFPVLPLTKSETPANLLTGSHISPFDYTAISWRSLDLSKAIGRLPSDAKSYLQVFASDSVIRDELYRQAEATEILYRYGKVVWGVVIYCDDQLLSPMSEHERDKPFSNHQLSCADILFDPTGQATVADLQMKANQLLAAVDTLNQQPTGMSMTDVAFYQLHRQDTKSRVFNLPYPSSIAAVDYRISSSWIWRRHLPNGMLSSKVVPIILDSGNRGEIMVLPSWLWDSTYYQYWLSMAYQQFGQGYDLRPYIHWQQKYGQDIIDTATQKRLFPKLKPSLATSLPVEKPSHLAVTTLDTIPPNIPSSFIQSQVPPTAKIQPSLATELTQQLLTDKHRLQAQLSTQDKDKEKKLVVVFGAVLLVIMVALIVAKLLR